MVRSTQRAVPATGPDPFSLRHSVPAHTSRHRRCNDVQGNHAVGEVFLDDSLGHAVDNAAVGVLGNHKAAGEIAGTRRERSSRLDPPAKVRQQKLARKGRTLGEAA